MLMEHDNNNSTNDDCDNDEYGRGIRDEDLKELSRDEDRGSAPTKKLDKDLSETLSKMALRLCSICGNFFKGQFKIHPQYLRQETLQGTGVKVYHASLSSLKQSVDSGCPLCLDLTKGLEERFREDPQLRTTTDQSSSIWCKPETWEWDWWEGIRGLRLYFFLCGQDGQRLSDGPHMFPVALDFFPPEVLGLGPEFRDLTLRKTTANSARSIDLARSWYKACLDHRSCRNLRRNTSTAPPTRLVRVQMLGHGSSSGLAASICETKTLSPGVECRYTTLSYRWGDGTMLKLEESNADTLRHEIPMDQLPTLVKDAMYMTCQLDIEYIWIDCLCILQGSKQDWKLEAAKMGDYYRYAQCNMSASGYVESSTTELFSERMALSFVNYPIRTDFALVSEVNGQEVETHYDGIYIRADSGLFHDDIIGGTLASRGWVAQERALSPGILHFTPRQMWWECTQHVVNEAFPTITLPWLTAQSFGAGAIRLINSNSSREDIYESWHDFVRHYATTELTFETDRFPAVVGIARIYADALHDDNFIAGMWEGDLVRSLAWSTDKKARRIPSVQIAPSWSWASLSSSYSLAYIGSPIDGICFKVLSSTPNFKSDLQTTTFEKSSVRGLEMTGPLRRLAVELEDLPHWREFATRVYSEYDVEDAPVFSGQDVAGQGWRWEGHTHILPLWKKEFSDRDPGLTVFGLLLQQVPAAELPYTFRRIGTVSFDFPCEELCDRYLGLMKENGNYKPSVDFEECGLQDFVFI